MKSEATTSESPGLFPVSVQFVYGCLEGVKDVTRSSDIFAEIKFSDGERENHSMKDWHGIMDANRDNPRYVGLINWLINALELDANGYFRNGSWKEVVQQALDTWIIGEIELKWLLFYSGASSSLSERFHVLINGDSQKGKSYVEEKVSQLFPQDRVMMVQSMSGKAPYYRSGKEGAEHYSNKILVLDEFADLSDDTRATVKALLSLGDRPLVNDTVGENKQPVRQVIEGRPVVWANSAELFDDSLSQLKNRFFTAAIDESEDLDRKINRMQRNRAKYGRSPEDLETAETAKKIVSQIVSDKGIIVLMPLIDEIKQRDMGNRGEFERFCVLVSSIAYVNRFQRPIFEDGGNTYVLASMADLNEATHLWNHFNRSQSTGICTRHQQVLDVMSGSPMTIEEITALVNRGKKKGKSTKTVYNYLVELADRDFVSSSREATEDGKSVTKYFLVNAGNPQLAQFFPSELWGDKSKLRGLLATEIGALCNQFPNIPKDHDNWIDTLLDGADVPTKIIPPLEHFERQTVKDLIDELRGTSPGAFHTLESLLDAGFDQHLLDRVKLDGMITIEPSGRWIWARG